MATMFKAVLMLAFMALCVQNIKTVGAQPMASSKALKCTKCRINVNGWQNEKGDFLKTTTCKGTNRFGEVGEKAVCCKSPSSSTESLSYAQIFRLTYEECYARDGDETNGGYSCKDTYTNGASNSLCCFDCA